MDILDNKNDYDTSIKDNLPLLFSLNDDFSMYSSCDNSISSNVLDNGAIPFDIAEVAF